NQEALLRQYAGEHGHDNITVYIDNGYSGLTIDDRPGMTEIRQGMKSGNIKTIIFKDYSRIARDIQLTFAFTNEAESLGVTLIPLYGGEINTVLDDFIKEFARLCVDKGADAIIGHGPHELRGIEIYNGKPIFYSLGNFIFQTETVAIQPADAYEKHSMSNLSTVGQYMSNRSKDGTRGYVVQPNIWRSVMAGMTAVDGNIARICLHPITLHMEEPRSRKGWPSIIKSDKEEVLEYLASLSKPFGTELRIENNCALMDL
ncbi:MAG: CapA family protein, partial [Synergistaceae bacterium]|nr:CapA family protein [Synergistaceae bacterium]